MILSNTDRANAFADYLDIVQYYSAVLAEYHEEVSDEASIEQAIHDNPPPVFQDPDAVIDLPVRDAILNYLAQDEREFEAQTTIHIIAAMLAETGTKPADLADPVREVYLCTLAAAIFFMWQQYGMFVEVVKDALYIVKDTGIEPPSLLMLLAHTLMLPPYQIQPAAQMFRESCLEGTGGDFWSHFEPEFNEPESGL